MKAFILRRFFRIEYLSITAKFYLYKNFFSKIIIRMIISMLFTKENTLFSFIQENISRYFMEVAFKNVFKNMR